MLLRNCIAVSLLSFTHTYVVGNFKAYIPDLAHFKDMPASVCIELEVNKIEQKEFNRESWETITKKAEFLIKVSEESKQNDSDEEKVYLAKLATELENIFLGAKDDPSIDVALYINTCQKNIDNRKLYIGIRFTPHRRKEALTTWPRAIAHLSNLIEYYKGTGDAFSLFSSLGKTLQSMFSDFHGYLDTSISIPESM